MREESNKKIVSYYDQVQQLALPGPCGEQSSKILSAMNKGFTSEELAILQKHELPIPSNVLMETLKDGDTVSEVLDKSGNINKELGRAKGHLSTTKTAQNKNKDKIAAYAKKIDVIKKYRRRIDVIEEGNKTLKIGMGNKKKRIQN